MLKAASSLAALPGWFARYPLPVASPAARQVVWALGRRLTGDPDVGFAIASRVPADAIGTLWTMYEVAPSLRVLSLSYDAYSSLLLEYMKLHVVDDGPITWFRLISDDGTEPDRAEQDYRAAAMLDAYRRLVQDPELAPVAVHFTYAVPRSTRAHRAALGTSQLRFSQPYLQVGLRQAVADAPFPRSDPAAFAQYLQSARARARALRASSLSDQVDELITERLARGVTEHGIADALGLSVRSLRRRLSEQGATFRSLLDRARRREGDLLLEDRELSIARVARMLGFANDGALRNSMRRWSPLSPRERRRVIVRASRG